MNTPLFHRCSRCRETRLDQFTKKSDTPSGLSYLCRACAKEDRKKYADTQRERCRAWYVANKAYKRDYYRDRYHTNPEFRERVLQLKRDRRAQRKNAHDDIPDSPDPE